MKETKKCFWCGHGEFKPLTKRSDGISVILCNHCELIQVAQSPDNLEELYYNENYYTPGQEIETIGYDDYYTLMNPLFLLWQSALIDATTNFAKKYRLLDVGCATGNLMEIINTYHPNISTKGIDISDYAVEHCKKKGLEAEKISISEDIGEKFDIIISLETLEHLDDLKTFVGGIQKNIKSNGSFMFYVPSVSRAEIEDKTKQDVRLKTNLEHLIYFTPEFFRNEFPKFFKKEAYVQEINSRYGRSIVGMVTNNKTAGSKFEQVFKTLTQTKTDAKLADKIDPDFHKDLVIIAAKFFEPAITEVFLKSYATRKDVTTSDLTYVKAIIDYHNGSVAGSTAKLLSFYNNNPSDTVVLKILLSNQTTYNSILLDEAAQLKRAEAELAEARAEIRHYKDSKLVGNTIRAKNLLHRLKTKAKP